MRYMHILAIIFFVHIGCSQNKSKPITEVSQNELKTVMLIDVRTPEEYAEGHLPNAMNINWLDADFAKNLETFDKNDTIYVYCKMGGRSTKAQAKLQELGYRNIINLQGGYDAWKKEN